MTAIPHLLTQHNLQNITITQKLTFQLYWPLPQLPVFALSAAFPPPSFILQSPSHTPFGSPWHTAITAPLFRNKWAHNTTWAKAATNILGWAPLVVLGRQLPMVALSVAWKTVMLIIVAELRVDRRVVAGKLASWQSCDWGLLELSRGRGKRLILYIQPYAHKNEDYGDIRPWIQTTWLWSLVSPGSHHCLPAIVTIIATLTNTNYICTLLAIGN